MAFSAGSTLNTAPVPDWKLSTLPWNVTDGTASMTMSTACAGAHPVELRLLEIRRHPALVLHQREQRLAGIDVVADIDRCGASTMPVTGAVMVQ